MAPILLCTKHVINRNMVTKMKPNTILTFLAIAATFGAMPAHAAGCTFSNTVAITGINLVNPDGSAGAALAIPDLNPTACIVVNDNISGNYPEGSNIGLLEQGVLNGGDGGGSNVQIFNPYFLPPSNPSTGIELNSAYLPGGASTYPQEKLVNGVDPGWIKLYSTDGGYGANPTLGNLSLVISQLMTISVSRNADNKGGEWSINLDPQIITQVQSVLGRNAFDHLAFILKSSQESIVYDFDFNVYAQYFASLGQNIPFDYVTPYDFSGTWATTDFKNDQGKVQGLSHLEIWARDPDGDQTIPEPASLALLGLGFAALSLSRRKNKGQ